ncbi:MAG: SAM-dependent methyltransferase, partial [Bacteroidetes bacterium]|nr:SAM-dependent methyltransferase [Bacteroidota bacterium]
FTQLHQSDWNRETALAPHFTLKKWALPLDQWLDAKIASLEDAEKTAGPGINIVYYDAFAPESQPELWTEAIFTRLYRLMAPRGVLVTYCSKSIVRKALQAAGFIVEKIPGPPGKREMLRGIK